MGRRSKPSALVWRALATRSGGINWEVPLRWELAADTDTHEIGIFAVVFNPLRELLLIRTFHSSAVDLHRVPAMAQAAKAFAEAPGGKRRVAEAEPDDLSAFVSKCAFGHFPH